MRQRGRGDSGMSRIRRHLAVTPAKFSEFEISKHSVGVTVKRTEEMTPDQRSAVLFGRQHGAASDRQLRSSAFSWEKQQRMIRNNLWRRYSAGVILLVGSPETWHQQVMAATLATSGALLSGPAAARLHRLDGFATTTTLQIVIPVDGHDRSPAGVAIRWSRRLTNADRYVVGGIPVTTLAVTLIHLHADGLAAEKALDSVLRQRKPLQWLKQTFERWQIGDTKGSATHLLRLLDDRIGQRLPRSWFQRLSHRIFDTESIHFVDEWPVHDGAGKLIAELDLADIDLEVGVECQSIEFHTSPADVARDVQRRRALRRLGWDIVEMWWSDLERMDEALADVRLALSRARKLQG